jgi:hypothetical protein
MRIVSGAERAAADSPWSLRDSCDVAFERLEVAECRGGVGGGESSSMVSTLTKGGRVTLLEVRIFDRPLATRVRDIQLLTHASGLQTRKYDH